MGSGKRSWQGDWLSKRTMGLRLPTDIKKMYMCIYCLNRIPDRQVEMQQKKFGTKYKFICNDCKLKRKNL